jgi:hypothetical protein
MMNTAESTKGEIDVSTLGPQSRQAHREREQAQQQALKRPDGRHLRRKGRTANLSFKVKPETVSLIQRLSQVEGISMVETLERALDLLDKTLKGQAGK